MSRKVAYLPEAEDDIDAAYQWYEQQRDGLGDRFLRALREAADDIQDNPNLYALFLHDIRAAPLRRFPYVVYYRDGPEGILVIAVQHGRRSNRAWQRRSAK